MTKTQIKLIQKYVGQLEEIREALNEIKGEAEDAHSAKSDKWQESEKGEKSQEWIDALDNGYNDLDTLVSTLTDLANEGE